MAKPIKDTPILTGESARKFEKVIRENEKKKVPREEFERAACNYRLVKLPG
ncbi:MAG: hypothetical protein JXA04_10640 [Gammaproteobacteria bacterium]|nr:hypothetical protein [Gammaproteobacteria bacterium]